MSDGVSGRELGQALCRIFGFEPENIERLTIEMDPNHLVTVTAAHIATPGQAEGVAHLVSRHRLVATGNDGL